MCCHGTIKPIIKILLLSLFTCCAVPAFASAFQIWEQGEAGVGDYHAGGAAVADNAVTGYYNPAGLVRLNNPQVTFGAAAIVTDINYSGKVYVDHMSPKDRGYVDVQGGKSAVIPNFHYAQPFNKNVVFGFGISVPLGLATHYGASTAARYVGAKATVQAVNIGPSLGIKITPKFSFGLGLDLQRLKGEFDEYAGYTDPLGNSNYDTGCQNRVYNWGYGWHGGVLYQFNNSARIGLSYHSKIVHHANGSSEFEGKLAGSNANSVLRSDRLETTLIMPATTSLSFYQELNSKWAWMTSLTYTQWGAFNNLVLKNAAGLDKNFKKTTDLTIVVPQHFRNTWNIALGGTYAFLPKWKLHAGVGFDESPVTSRYRTILLPDNNRYVLSLGLHYQARKNLSFDLGWTHLFLKKARVNSSMTIGPETSTADGYMTARGDVFGAQISYDFA